MADDLDPFEESLREGLEGLRSTPDRPAVERGLGAVTRLGHRRRQRRRVAGGIVVVAAAVSLGLMAGRVEGAADWEIRLGGLPGQEHDGDRTGGTVVVGQPGDESGASTTTRGVETTLPGPGGTNPDGSPTTTGVPGPGGVDGGNGTPAGPNGPAVTTTASTRPGAQPTVTDPAPVTTVPPPPTSSAPAPAGCQLIDLTGGGVIAPVPNSTLRCYTVARGGSLTFSGEWLGAQPVNIQWAGQPAVLVRITGPGSMVSAGSASVLPAGSWSKFDIMTDYGTLQWEGSLYIRAQ
jgi:hypothetical protein